MFLTYDQLPPSIIVGTGGELAELTALECGCENPRKTNLKIDVVRQRDVQLSRGGWDDGDSWEILPFFFFLFFLGFKMRTLEMIMTQPL